MTERLPGTGPALLEAAGLSYAYGDQVVLRDIDLTFRRGRFYGILGPNGCGKTTLLDLLGGSRKPRTGTVHLNGQPVSRYRRRDIAREIALVPQEFDPGFGFTVEESVLMGRHPHMKRFAAPTREDWLQVDAALSAIGIAELRHRPLDSLSGGQKQRTVVARALAQNTAVLFFDEATSNLDIRYTLRIFSQVRRRVDEYGHTVLAVIHDLNLAAAYCDELVLLSAGTIRASGPAARTLTETNIGEVFAIDTRVAFDDFSGCPQVSYNYRPPIR